MLVFPEVEQSTAIHNCMKPMKNYLKKQEGLAMSG